MKSFNLKICLIMMTVMSTFSIPLLKGISTKPDDNLKPEDDLNEELNAKKKKDNHLKPQVLSKPKLKASPNNKPKLKANPNDKPELGNPDSKPELGANSNSKPELGNPKTKPELGNPKTKPELGNPNSKPELGNPNSKPELGDNPKPELGANPNSKPELGNPNLKPEPDANPNTKPELGANPNSKSELGNPKTKPELGNPNSKPELGNPNLKSEPDANPNTKPELGANPNSKSELGNPKTKPELGNPKTKPELGNPNSKPELGNPNSKPELRTNPKPELGANPNLKPELGANPKPELGANPKPELGANPNSKPELGNPNLKPELRTNPKPELDASPNSKPELRTNPKPELGASPNLKPELGANPNLKPELGNPKPELGANPNLKPELGANPNLKPELGTKKETDLNADQKLPGAPVPAAVKKEVPANSDNIFASLFTDPSRASIGCPNKESAEELLALKVNIGENGSVWAAPQKKENPHEKKKMGWEASSYLFDYLDDVLQKEMAGEFDRIYKEAQMIKPPQGYREPYSLVNLMGLKAENDITSKEQMLKKIMQIAPNFNYAVWEHSITSGQMNGIINVWGWYSDSTKPDMGKYIVDKYDYDGDGRLNPGEFIIAMIRNNKNVWEGIRRCMNCMENIIQSKIDLIYMFLDCSNTNIVGSEMMWNGLQRLKRSTLGYDIYKCELDNGKYRTSAINDFILKTHELINGKMTKEEFRLGILTGYWNRQTDNTRILLGDERNMKNFRWTDNGNVDNVCERIKNKINSNKK